MTSIDRNLLRRAVRWSRESKLRRRAQYYVQQLDMRPLTDFERAELDAWLEADIRHEHAFREAWTAQSILEATVLNLRRDAAETVSKAVSRRTIWWGVSGLAAALAIAAVLFGLQMLHADVVLYETRTGESRHVKLPDGSTIQLSTRTQVRLEQCPAARCLTLLAGEVFFKVAKDRSRPFIVRVGGNTISVTGTEFDVRRRQSPARTDVTVAEGTVIVTGGPIDHEWRRELHANEQIAVSSQNIISETHPASSANASSWREGALEIDDTVSAALCRLSEFIDAPVEYDPQVAEYRVSTRLDLSDVRRTLTDLPAHFPIVVERVGDSYLVRLRTLPRRPATVLERCP